MADGSRTKEHTMSRQLRIGKGACRVTSTHRLLTGSWTVDVETMESAVGRFTVDRPLGNECQVVFFEIAGDNELHVNVTHRRATKAVAGWAGPARLPDGFVNNRRFGGTPPDRIIRHIREM